MKKWLIWGVIFCGILGNEGTFAETTPVMSEAYYEIWSDAVQKEIDARIEKYRKAEAEITLENVQVGSVVKVEQISHDFLFGAHIFNFEQLGTEERNAKYKELYGTLFNSATIAFYWKKFEMERGKPRFQGEYRDTAEFWNQCADPKNQPHWRRPATDPVVEYCESRGIQMLGHTLIWDSPPWNTPEWLPNDVRHAEELEHLFEKRIVEIARHYQGRLNRWDVVNESWYDFQDTSVTGKKVIPQSGRYKQVMPGDYVYKAFRTADREFPSSVQLNINDFMINDKYVEQVNDLRKHGCRIDIVGQQMHLFNPNTCLEIAAGKEIYTPEILWRQLSLLEKTRLPIHVSEITITAPDDNQKGRAIQAEVAKNFYRLWFSHPSVMGITWWNVVDDCGAPGEPTTSGLFTREMEPKPSYFALNKLIHEDWKTTFTQKAENSQVNLKFRGFKGKYRITWTNAAGKEESQEIHLTNP